MIYLRERDGLREVRLKELRKTIQVGLDGLGRGERSPLNIEAIKREVLRNLAPAQS